MANLFLGFPVPRAKIAEMIEGSAPPSLHHTQHETGGTDILDGTKIPGAGGISNLYDAGGIFLNDWFESIDGWRNNSGGGGTVTLYQNCVDVRVDTTQYAVADLSKRPDIWQTGLTWNKQLYFKADVRLYRAAANSGIQWIRAGTDAWGHQVSFKVNDGLLQGSVGDGNDETLTTWSESLGAGAYDVKKRLEIKYKVTSCEFWVNGVLVETLSAGLPAGTSKAYILFSLVCDSDVKTVAMFINCSWFKLWKEV